MQQRRSTPPAHFDALYAARPDPWNLAGSAYEAGKYAETIRHLRGRRFASALEIGCSIGVLTARLAPHCDRILAVDCAETALESARQRFATSASVQFARMVLPGEWPAGFFDLVMLSEILYFWDERDIALAARRVARCLLPGGLVLAVNWRGPNDGALPGDAAASRFMAALPQSWQRAPPTLRQAYRLDVAERPL